MKLINVENILRLIISRRQGFWNKLDEPVLAAMAQDVELHGVGVQLDCARLLVDLE